MNDEVGTKETREGAAEHVLLEERREVQHDGMAAWCEYLRNFRDLSNRERRLFLESVEVLLIDSRRLSTLETMPPESPAP